MKASIRRDKFYNDVFCHILNEDNFDSKWFGIVAKNNFLPWARIADSVGREHIITDQTFRTAFGSIRTKVEDSRTPWEKHMMNVYLYMTVEALTPYDGLGLLQLGIGKVL